MQMRSLSKLVPLLVASMAIVVGCGQPTSPGGGGSGGDASSTTATDATTSIATTTSTVATTSNTSVTTGSVASSSSSSMATPCVALKDGIAPNPTPGVCQGNVAVTCGQDGFLTQETCTGGATCSTYDLKERKFNGTENPPMWEAGRTVTWAACKPAGTGTCTMAFDGNTYNPAVQPSCNGADKINCENPPAPDLFSSSPQLQYGSADAWLITTACGANQRCAGSDDDGILTCIDDSTPACDGTEPFCTPQGIVECHGTWESQPGYRETMACGVGDICQTTTAGPACLSTIEVPCDVPTFGPPQCAADGGSIVTCYDGFTNHQSCATCLDDNHQTVPCHCDTVDSNSGYSYNQVDGLTCTDSASLQCVPQAAVDCDSSVDVDTCVGNVAHRCLGQWHDLDCSLKGLLCGVNDGLAGCKAATAAACDLGTYQAHCAGTKMVGCCACNTTTILFGPAIDPCVPGFEVTDDCATMGSYNCKPPVWPFNELECVYSP